MSDFHKSSLIWGTAILLFCILIGFGAFSGASMRHQQNMDCVNAGGSWEPISSRETQLICKK